jgi:hypothetical protein
MPFIEDANVAPSTGGAVLNLGFLTIVHENAGYVGAYLVTNHWGRPLEFRLSSSIQPNRIQQILYGGTLQPYICADLIGKTLVEKTSAVAGCIFTDCEAALDLRLRVQVPVIWLAQANDPVAEDLAQEGACIDSARVGDNTLVHHPRMPADNAVIRELLERLDEAFDLSEPFARVREALAEARKMGVTGRA